MGVIQTILADPLMSECFTLSRGDHKGATMRNVFHPMCIMDVSSTRLKKNGGDPNDLSFDVRLKGES